MKSVIIFNFQNTHPGILCIFADYFVMLMKYGKFFKIILRHKI